MQKRSLLLVLAVSALSAAAASQQIVIEPTNGRAQAPATRVTRPAATDIAPVSKAERPTHAQRAAPKPAVNHHTEKQVAKVKTAPVVEAKNEPRETIPAPAQPAAPQKKYPARPAWAMNDTRDPNDLEQEITQAFAGDSKLKGSAIQVKVDDEAVTLEGRALGTEERLQAERLAQSYAWNRKLVDRVEVSPRVSAQK